MDSKYKFRVEIQQMMFVSGATNDPPLQTVMVVEDIVRAQVVELINRGTSLARRRGARSIAVDDIMFLIRHDSAKVNRLSTYLAWKDVRKNARDQDSGAPSSADGPDILEDPSAALGGQDKRAQKTKRVGLLWKPQNAFAIPMSAVNMSKVVRITRDEAGQAAEEAPEEEIDPSMGDDMLEGVVDNSVADADALGEGDTDEEDSEATQIMNERLRNADLRTQNMTREEYVHWSECRQASFTFRKAKRFKEWAGLSQITDSRLQDDIMDVMGFLTFEIVANLTGAAIKVKARWESKRKRDEPDRPQTGQLFKQSNRQETVLLPEHVRAAYAQYEMPSGRARAMQTWQGGRTRHEVKLI